jgi:hypothetical protein
MHAVNEPTNAETTRRAEAVKAAVRRRARNLGCNADEITTAETVAVDAFTNGRRSSAMAISQGIRRAVQLANNRSP